MSNKDEINFQVEQVASGIRNSPFSIPEYPTPNAPDGNEINSFTFGGVFPDDHFPIKKYLHKSSPPESLSIDPYNQKASKIDIDLQKKDDLYNVYNPNQNLTYIMDPRYKKNGENARGGRFAMDLDQLENYRRREYTVEMPVVLKNNINYIDTNNRYYPYPGFFLSNNPDYLTYGNFPNYYGTAPITTIPFQPINAKRFYYMNQMMDPGVQKIENGFSRPNLMPNANQDIFMEGFKNDEKKEDFENLDEIFKIPRVILFVLIFFIILFIWKLY